MTNLQTGDGIDALFAAPQIRTDEHGVHTDDTGRYYTLVDVDGETDFRPVTS